MAPTLPLSLLREIGVEGPAAKSHRGSRSRQPSRKDRRKAERSATKASRYGPQDRHPPVPPMNRTRLVDSEVVEASAPRTPRAPAKPILKRKREPEPEPEPGSGSDEPTNGEDSGVGEEDGSHRTTTVIPKAVRDKLAEDDAEIADLERKLGLKSRKKLPESFKVDGLDDLLDDIDAVFDDEAHERKKRKTEADEWLAQKRAKALTTHRVAGGEGANDSDASEGCSERSEPDDAAEDIDDVSDTDLNEAGSLSGDSSSGYGDAFEGFGSEPGAGTMPHRAQQQPRQRENPYVAPTSGAVLAKYVPPSLRAAQPVSDAELMSRIRRQTQGLVNRLTETNLVSVLGEVDKLYREHPRQHVTSTLADLLLVQICDPSSLPDTLLILTAGFATALYRVIGMDFGAHLVQATTEKFKVHFEKAAAGSRERQEASKEASNLITFLAEMYNFQLISCSLIFDHVRLLLEELTEFNAELLLRIIRMCGKSLRQDDPMALKDIAAMIRPAVWRIGEQNISVRTKFMIETINDLKNNKMKAGASASAVITEHTVRMRKILGSLNARKLKATEPLRMGLRDIEESDKRGKWWLIGSSWAGAGKTDGANPQKHNGDGPDESDREDDQDDDGFGFMGQDGIADVAVLAKEQMMNTDVRRSIFVAIMSATDCDDAQRRVIKLRLSRDRQREIPNVLLRCGGSEQLYNPYYALVARRLCASDRKVRWAFQDALWRLFRRLGESLFGEAADEDVTEGGADDDEDDATSLRRIVNVAKMYGFLIAEGVLGLQILKCLNLVYVRPKTRAFVEVLLITAILEAEANNKRRSAGGTTQKQTMINDAATADDAVWIMFQSAAGGGPDFARGLRYFLRKVVRKSDLGGGKANTRTIRRGCQRAETALERTFVEQREIARGNYSAR